MLILHVGTHSKLWDVGHKGIARTVPREAARASAEVQ